MEYIYSHIHYFLYRYDQRSCDQHDQKNDQYEEIENKSCEMNETLETIYKKEIQHS